MSSIRDNFTDNRSRKVCFVAYCILNQNATYNGSKIMDKFPAMVDPVVDFLKNNRIGIEQLPCFEQVEQLPCVEQEFGFNRSHSCRQKIDTPAFREYCRKEAQRIANRIKRYQEVGIKVVGVIGRRGSPACGVDTVRLTEKEETPGKGVFIEELSRLVEGVPFVQFDYKKVEESMESINELLTMRADKPDSVKDREQKQKGEYYYLK